MERGTMKLVFNFHIGSVSVHCGGDSDMRLARIEERLETIMGVLDDMRVTLGEINETTDELAADIDDLMARLAGGITAEEADDFADELGAVRDRLRGVAGEWPVVVAPPVEEPPVEEPPA